MHPPSNEGCICNPYILICSVTDSQARNSTTVLPDKPQGVADAAELLLVGLPFVNGGHGVLAKVLDL